jgi:uncharacterized membrane protein
MGEKTITGLDENIAGLLCYLLGIVTGIVFYILESENKFIKFHALQSIIVFGNLLIISGVVVPIIFTIPLLGSIVGSILSLVVSIAALVLWIVLMFKAYQGEKYKVPIAGDLAEKYV